MIRAGKDVEHRRAEDLHVTSQHDEFDAVLGQGRDQGLLLGLTRLGCHRQVAERDAVERRQRGVVVVVADDDGHLGRQFAGLAAGQQVGEAVRLGRGEDGDAGPVGQHAGLDRHAEAGGDRGEGLGKGPRVQARRVELDPLEEHARLDVDVLLGVHDVATQPQHEFGDAVDHARLVGAGQQQDRRGHSGPLSACGSAG